MKVFVLSLASDVKKRAVFEKHFSCTKLSFSFFDGVDGQELCRKPSASDKLLYMPLEESCLTPGEIGCALGHFAIYREIVDKNMPILLNLMLQIFSTFLMRMAMGYLKIQ